MTKLYNSHATNPYMNFTNWSHENARKQKQLKSEKSFAQKEWPEEALLKNLEIPV